MNSLNDLSAPKVMVWTGILNRNIIGPYFFPGNVDSNAYLEMLGNFVLPELDRLGFNPHEICYLHDGAPAHYTIDVREFLNEHFQSWIGRGAGPLIDWAPRSPDFNKCDIFLWPFIKNIVYKIKSNTIDELQNKIDEAHDHVTLETLDGLQRNLIERLEKCIGVDGAIFEHLIN